MTELKNDRMPKALTDGISRGDCHSVIPSFVNSVILLSLLACHPTTPRPYFAPVTGAQSAEIELRVPVATQLIADLLTADSFPVSRIETRDGFLETAWFDTATGQPTRRRRLGGDVVQVRAWIDPTRAGHSQFTIETVIRPLADPSVSDRELDQQAPPDHPTAKRVKAICDQLVKQYGDTTST